MRAVLKPLFEAELPADFSEVIKGKLMGEELRTGEEIEVELLGKSLRFKVVLAEPSPLKVGKSTRIEFSQGEVEVVDFEFEGPVSEVIPFEKGFVIAFEREVLILNHNGQKIYSDEFDDLKAVRVSKNSVVIIYEENKIRLVKP
ncbi:ATPase [Thermococcus celericrescens]|uniref:ATPase n=1 Tax=Thermococcus celericrescens TaxID=227598 RepID=A0A100XVG0_9EURY|nr:ATPase [Thermococcus celericrescens]KUH31321.1 ATPase [Thermococcus celericrescens]